jgi:4-hydroxybenzoate polyprenyltransferase
MRLDKPIGILLLLWPTLWALWLASNGEPDTKILFIFVTGVILMRSAGCVLNDFADRNIDGMVARTRNRPFPSGKVKAKEALFLAALLLACAFLLVLQTNLLTIKLAFVGAGLTVVYPLMKRYTDLPQGGLAMAFSWGVPMAFAAVTGKTTTAAWVLFSTGMLWPLIYDTMYAMVDRSDDINIGVKSSAILFDTMDKLVIALLQVLFVVMLIIIGLMFALHKIYYLSLIVVSVLFVYQQWLIKDRDPKRCFKAFLNNNWVGLLIFIGIGLSYVR